MLRNHWKSLAWAILVFILFSIPSSQVEKVSLIQIPHFDKLIHFIMLMVLALLLISEFNKHRRIYNVSPNAFLWAAIISIGYGAVLEILQHFVFTSRYASLWDIMANFLGVTAALFLYRLVNRATRGIL
jgi:VanZ family protein